MGETTKQTLASQQLLIHFRVLIVSSKTTFIEIPNMKFRYFTIQKVRTVTLNNMIIFETTSFTFKIL